MTTEAVGGPSTRVVAAEAELARIAPGYLGRVREAAERLALRDHEGTDTEAALQALDELSVIDLEPPTASRIPAARLAKKVIKRMISWYLGYFGRQVTALGQAVSHLGTVILYKTERVESATEKLRSDLDHLAARVDRLERGER